MFYVDEVGNYLTSRQAAEMAGVAHSTMRAYARKYPDLAIKVANRLLIDRQVLRQLIEQGKVR